MSNTIKVYTLKKLPVSGAANFADLGALQARVEVIETLLNLLKINFTANEETPLPEDAKDLFIEMANYETAFAPEPAADPTKAV